MTLSSAIIVMIIAVGGVVIAFTLMETYNSKKDRNH